MPFITCHRTADPKPARARFPSNSGFSLHSDGGGHESLTLGYDGEERKLGENYAVTEGKYGSLGMNGREVYKFATREVRGFVAQVLLGGGLNCRARQYVTFR